MAGFRSATSRSPTSRAVAAAAPLITAGATAIQLPIAQLADDIERAQAVVHDLTQAIHALGR